MVKGGSGKALPVDTEIITPYGTKTMGEVEIGDVLCDTLGGTCVVLNKWDNPRRKVYKISFEDGRTIECADNHKWEFYIHNKSYVGTTLDLMVALTSNIVSIPLTCPVYQENTFDKPIPFALGSLIASNFSLDRDYLENTDEELLDAKLIKSDGRFIRNFPKAYLDLDVESRIGLIATLCYHNGEILEDCIQICMPNPNVAKKVRKVIWSLGGICTLKFSTISQAYTLRFYFDDEDLNDIFLGAIENNRKKPVRHHLGLKIESIEYIGENHCQCIEVDSPNHLYLAGDYICTHNSEAICQRVSYLFMNRKDMVFAVVRATMPALTRSVYLGDPSICKTLSDWGVPVDKWLNKTEATLRNPDNGNVLYFMGLDDPEKIKSMNINYVFIEEATEINADKWAQLNTRMRRHNPYGKNQMFLSYNPISWYNWVVQMFVANPDPIIKNDTLVHFSNFSQNPYVAIENVKSMFARASHDEAYYRTYIIGMPGKPLGLIYPNIVFTHRDSWPEGVWDAKPYYGIDWGFIDPMVLTECRDYEGKIYVICRFYKTKVTTKEFLEFMKQIKVPKTSNIYYDSADAERGNLLLQAGYTGFKAKKNINAGISYVKGFDIVVDSGGPYGQNAMDEVQGYTWQTDPDDSSKFIEEPIEINNHFCVTGDTTVITDRGLVPIKDVRIGDLALSHMGFKPIVDWAKTGENERIFELTLKNGVKLRGTADHPIVTVNGLKYLKSIATDDKVIVCVPKLKQSNTIQKDVQTGYISQEPVVENPTRGIFQTLTSSALSLANQRLEKLRGLKTRKEFVKSVIKSSSQEIDEISDDFKDYLLSIEDVESVTEVGREDVYEITVEDAHDFFANGILTLQCDSLRYAIVTEHMYNRNFGTASLSLSVDEAMKKSGILVPDDNTGM